MSGANPGSVSDQQSAATDPLVTHLRRCPPVMQPSESSKIMKTSTSTAKDPICGMVVDTAAAIHVERNGKTFYFCGDGCRTKFNALPNGKPQECKSTSCCE